MVKLLNRFRRKKEEQPKAPAAPPADIVLLTEMLAGCMVYQFGSLLLR